MAGIDKVKILVVGDSGVGKTSLVHLICHSEPTTNPGWTIGCSVEVKLHEYKAGTAAEKTYFVELWDIGGCTSHQNSRSIFYQPVNGIILVHDLTNRKSEHNLRVWLAEVLKRDNKSSGNGYEYDPEQFAGTQIPLLVIGTKFDQAEGMRNQGKIRSSSVADEFGADQFYLDCQMVKYLAPGSTNAVKLSRFFDKVIERRFYSRDCLRAWPKNCRLRSAYTCSLSLCKISTNVVCLEKLSYKGSSLLLIKMSDRVDLQDVMRLLTRLDERLGKIELKVGQSEHDTKTLPPQAESKTFDKSQTRYLDVKYDGCRDNWLNRDRRREFEDFSTVRQKSDDDDCDRNLKKSSSFRDKPNKKLKGINTRNSFSIPPEREEAKRRSQFRRECLSNAIRWNTVDIVNSLNGMMFTLPHWLKRNEVSNIRHGKNEKSQIRRFILILVEQNFEKMQNWLQERWIENDVLRMVWNTYEEFSDSETNTLKLKCFVCRLAKLLPVDLVIDYLRSADIISKATYVRADDSCLPLEAEADIWKLIVAECRIYSIPKQAINALTIALSEALQHQATIDKDGIEGLLLDIASHQGDYQLLFYCQCSERCAKSLHPVSVMKSMSLVQAYMSSPSKVGNNFKTDVQSPIPASSLSSSLDSTEKSSSDTESKSSDEEQTSKKSVFSASHSDSKDESFDMQRRAMTRDLHSSTVRKIDKENDRIEMDLKVLPENLLEKERPSRKMSLKAVRRRERKAADVFSSDTTSDVDLIRETVSQRSSHAGRRCTAYTKQQTAQAMQNNPQIIYGKNVYISHV